MAYGFSESNTFVTSTGTIKDVKGDAGVRTVTHER